MKNGDASRTQYEEEISNFKLPFPEKLYNILEDSENGIHTDVISWLPESNGFKIHKPKKFCDFVMTKYFLHAKFSSFTRQCKYLENLRRYVALESASSHLQCVRVIVYLYGFLKLSTSSHGSGFYHPQFIRGNKQSCLSIRRNHNQGDRRLKKAHYDMESPSSENSPKNRMANASLQTTSPSHASRSDQGTFHDLCDTGFCLPDITLEQHCDKIATPPDITSSSTEEMILQGALHELCNEHCFDDNQFFSEDFFSMKSITPPEISAITSTWNSIAFSGGNNSLEVPGKDWLEHSDDAGILHNLSKVQEDAFACLTPRPIEEMMHTRVS